MLLGTTYSHRHINHLSLNNGEAFSELLKLNFNIIRLCCYWDEIQPAPDNYDFSKIISLLEKCEQTGQNVILTVGMKAPRWPEFYLPVWLKNTTINTLSDEVNNLITKTVQTLKKYSCIKYWQVENEPLDPSGPANLTIPYSILSDEIKTLKKINKTGQIIINVWGNEAGQRKTLTDASKLSDIIGLDLYYKVPIFKKIYIAPSSPPGFYEEFISASPKPVWITELQAEPWEKNKTIFQSPNPPSMNPVVLKANFEKAISLNPSAILFWGYEYWFWRKKMGDERMWMTAKNLINGLQPMI